MTLKDIGEFGFIDRISRGCLIRPAGIVKAIGDDAAAFRSDPELLNLVTTDLLIERVHFMRDAADGYSLGYKALAVNLSDIAAMGGTARNAFVSIAVPQDVTLDFLDDFYRGIKRLAAEHEVNILGGDTTGSSVDLIINVVVTGTVAEKEVLFRDKARVGDVIFSSGCLGDSRAGLHLVLNRITAGTPYLKTLLNAHLRPKPLLREGRLLAAHGGVHAAIDVSDGLSSDLGHIVRLSRVGARLFIDRLPLTPALQQFCRRFGFDPVEYALAGGEDYALLFTVAPSEADAIARDYFTTFGQSLHRLGEITDSGKIELIEGSGVSRVIVPTGWNHFKKES
ncbi:MAG: thiamine-phosphate kinase [Desulfuromonadales bacterium]